MFSSPAFSIIIYARLVDCKPELKNATLRRHANRKMELVS